MLAAEALRHMDLIRELSKPGHALSARAATASVNNRDWWCNGKPTLKRDRLHRRLIKEAHSGIKELEHDRVAIVLAGPPGAGKTTLLHKLLGMGRNRFLTIDADDFKRLLLDEAIRDGSYEEWLKPDLIRQHEAKGEKFFPLELAALVHEESSYLAQELRKLALRAGDNIIIDTVLSSESVAISLGQELQSSHYTIDLVNVEVTYEISEKRIRSRWEKAYSDALKGADPLGGRWVPSEYAHNLFDDPQGTTKSERAAQALAKSCPAVLRYRVFRPADEDPSTPGELPIADVDMSRTSKDSPLKPT